MVSPHLSTLSQGTFPCERRKKISMSKHFSSYWFNFMVFILVIFKEHGYLNALWGETPNRGSVLPVFSPYDKEDAATPLLLLMIHPFGHLSKITTPAHILLVQPSDGREIPFYFLTAARPSTAPSFWKYVLCGHSDVNIFPGVAALLGSWCIKLEPLRGPGPLSPNCNLLNIS